MNRAWQTAARIVVAASLMAALLPGVAAARPNYFATFVGIYGFVPGDDLYACGVCHRNWQGTGARNPFGLAIEQQLYIGKTISDAILAVEPADTDGDGFTNGDEIAVHHTLPGYACDNYELVIDPPPYFQSIITPGVPSCLEPKDIMVAPQLSELVVQANQVAIETFHLINNGTDFPITVSNYSMVAGSHPTLSLSGPPLPIVIPVGGSVAIDLVFAPTTSVFAIGTVRIESDDPDEAVIDLAATGIGFVKNLAPAATRAACFKEVEKRFEQFSKTHFREWGRCYTDELSGIACDTGRRDFKVGQAAAKFRSFVGGTKDRLCKGQNLSPPRLDLPTQCGAPCGSIAINSIAAWVNCLVCQQDAARDTMLQSSMGVAPPDLPLSTVAPPSQSCARRVVQAVQKRAQLVEKQIAACRLANVTAAVPVDCDTTLAAAVDAEAAKVDAVFDRCSSSTGLLACRNLPMPDPQCLGDATQGLAGELVDAVFDTAP